MIYNFSQRVAKRRFGIKYQEWQRHSISGVAGFNKLYYRGISYNRLYPALVAML